MSDWHLISPHSITLECKGHEKTRNDHQFKKLQNVKHILLVSTTGNVQKTVWRVSILMLECKGLRSKGKCSLYLEGSSLVVFCVNPSSE